MNFLKLFNRIGLIAAHRGANSIAPENTLTALKKSVGYCDFIEIDVQLSKDFVPIIMHDDTLQRTSNVQEIEAFKSRKPYLVHDFTFEELSTLDYGSWFNKEHEPLLTLNDALEFIKDKHLYMNVEIKDMHNSFSDETVVSTVLKKIVDKDLQNQVLISSFRHEYLLMIKEKAPNIATAALVEDEHPNELIEYLKRLHVDAYNLNDELVDEKILAKLKKAGFFVNVYTVNDAVRAKELFDMGVNGIFTDFL
ncbi:MAG: glycerophosphodiester phosphodiesterase family protein [Sulfurimonas sp.]|nr:glycerophosphodiester phosphodiesterase family protein [Sulfurimonas sp.]